MRGGVQSSCRPRYSSTLTGTISTEFSSRPVVFRKTMCRATASRCSGVRRALAQASSSDSSVNSCSISIGVDGSGNRSHPRYRCSQRPIGHLLGARYTGLNRQPREGCKINQPNGLHEASNDSPLKLNGFATVTFCTTVTRTPMIVSVLPNLSESSLFHRAGIFNFVEDGLVFTLGVNSLLCVGSVTVSAPPDGGGDGGLELLPETMLQPRRYIGS